MAEYRERYQSWIEDGALDGALREELASIRGDEKELEDRFYRELDFGTAGLRGVIGAGDNRMNVHVVRKATLGLAKYLGGIMGANERGVAIAYDSRNMSDAFARETACTLAQNGIRSYLYDSLRSVPQLSFAVTTLGCIAGVVITASHNPPQYNGYKVYWEHGGQIGPEQAKRIIEQIRLVKGLPGPGMPLEKAVESGFVTMIGREIDEAYYAATSSLLLHPGLDHEKGSELKLVYTPLHGTGNVPVRELLRRVGFTNVNVVEAQEKPDSSFPTVAAPNPEDPKAFSLAFELADAVGADAAVATDPDADRMGLAVRGAGGQFRVLTGNQIGSLLLYYILSQKSAAGTLPKDALAVRSIVSTRLADAICAAHGVKMETVLTGFRFISEIIADCEKTKRNTFLFGFEESFGFLAGTFSRDKDAISATMLAAEAALYYAQQGKTLADVLEEIYRRYGYYLESVKSYTLAGKEGLERIAGAMAKLRKNPPGEIGGTKVLTATDLLASKCVMLEGGTERAVALPPSDVLLYDLDGDAWACIRPSGTEPKLKLYVGVHDAVKARAQELASALLAGANAQLEAFLG
ncbi:MAG: phospho-sugar mutase [Bacillota bacterium]